MDTLINNCLTVWLLSPSANTQKFLQIIILSKDQYLCSGAGVLPHNTYRNESFTRKEKMNSLMTFIKERWDILGLRKDDLLCPMTQVVERLSLSHTRSNASRIRRAKYRLFGVSIYPIQGSTLRFMTTSVHKLEWRSKDSIPKKMWQPERMHFLGIVLVFRVMNLSEI